MAEPVDTAKPKCVECDRMWLPWDTARWRAYLGGDDLLDPGEVFFYCPDCAERDFGRGS